MTRAVLIVAAALSACATTRATRPTVVPALEPGTFTQPQVGPEWQGPSVETGEPVPVGGGQSAVLLARRAGDRYEVALAVGRSDGPAALLSIASIDVAGSRREAVWSLSPFALDGERLLRADVRVFETVEPRFFAVKSVLVSTVGEPTVVLDRLVESGDDVRDRRAAVAARDIDGDGTVELVVEESETGNPTHRTLVYRRGADGRFTTREPSLFSD